MESRMIESDCSDGKELAVWTFEIRKMMRRVLVRRRR